MPQKVPLSMRSVGSSDDGAVIRVATAWLGRAMQWLLVRVRVITLTQTSCAIVRSASEVHNSAEPWLRRPAEKACCQDMARAARVIEPCASDVVLDTCHRLQTAGTTPLRSYRPRVQFIYRLAKRLGFAIDLLESRPQSRPGRLSPA